MTVKKIQFIKDPIHGYIFISDLDKELIDTKYFQRLRRIKQLSGSEYVYPGANHTRFEHSSGTRYICEKMINNLQRNEKFYFEDEDKELILTGLTEFSFCLICEICG